MERAPEVGVAVAKLLFGSVTGVTEDWQLVTPRWQVGERWVTVVRYKGTEGSQAVESATEIGVTVPDVALATPFELFVKLYAFLF